MVCQFEQLCLDVCNRAKYLLFAFVHLRVRCICVPDSGEVRAGRSAGVRGAHRPMHGTCKSPTPPTRMHRFSLPDNHTLRRISQPIPLLGTQSSSDAEPVYHLVTFTPLTRLPGHDQASVYSQGVVVLSLPDNIPPLERKIVFQVRVKQ